MRYTESPAGHIYGLILLLILTLCPIAVLCILSKQTHPLNHPYYRVRIGTLYLNVDTVDKPLALLFTPLFLVRRLVFALLAVAANNVLVQLFVTMYASLGLILFYSVVWPMNDTTNNVIQLGNEIFFFVCVLFMLIFTDYSTDPIKRHIIGYVYLTFLAVNIVTNIVLIASTIVK